MKDPLLYWTYLHYKHNEFWCCCCFYWVYFVQKISFMTWIFHNHLFNMSKTSGLLITLRRTKRYHTHLLSYISEREIIKTWPTVRSKMRRREVVRLLLFLLTFNLKLSEGLTKWTKFTDVNGICVKRGDSLEVYYILSVGKFPEGDKKKGLNLTVYQKM